MPSAKEILEQAGKNNSIQFEFNENGITKTKVIADIYDSKPIDSGKFDRYTMWEIREGKGFYNTSTGKVDTIYKVNVVHYDVNEKEIKRETGTQKSKLDAVYNWIKKEEEKREKNKQKKLLQEKQKALRERVLNAKG